MTKHCDWCGKEYDGERDRASGNYCRGRCRTAFYRHRKKIDAILTRISHAMARLNLHRAHPLEWSIKWGPDPVPANEEAPLPYVTSRRYVDGYVIVSIKNTNGRMEHGIREHRWVMERDIGRPLLPDETVHHRNGIRSDNRLENLELWNKPHPAGQRVADLVASARETLARYGEEYP